LVGEIFDSAQLRKIPDADQFPCGQLACGILHHDVRAAGDGEPLSGIPRKKRQHRRQTARRDEFIFGWMRSHLEAPRRPASATASTICTYPVRSEDATAEL